MDTRTSWYVNNYTQYGNDYVVHHYLVPPTLRCTMSPLYVGCPAIVRYFDVNSIFFSFFCKVILHSYVEVNIFLKNGIKQYRGCNGNSITFQQLSKFTSQFHSPSSFFFYYFRQTVHQTFTILFSTSLLCSPRNNFLLPFLLFMFFTALLARYLILISWCEEPLDWATWMWWEDIRPPFHARPRHALRLRFAWIINWNTCLNITISSSYKWKAGLSVFLSEKFIRGLFEHLRVGYVWFLWGYKN